MDYSETPEFKRWKRRIERDLDPMIRGSKVVISLCPPAGKTDAKFAVELGLSIMLDKPIIVVVSPGTKVPEKLVLVADEIVEVDRDSFNEASQERLRAAMTRIIDREG